MKRSNLHAFTLVELMVSMVILSGLIVLLFSVVDGTTKTWNQSEQRVDSFREARAALFIISRDLQTMVPAPILASTTPTPSPTPLSTPTPTPGFKYFFVNPDPTDVSFAGVTEQTYADRIFFLTAQPRDAQANGAKSDVCAVGYYLDYNTTSSAIAAPPTFKLYRYFKDSDVSSSSLKAYTASSPALTPLMQAASSTDEVLARNVVDFRIVAYDKDFKKITIATTDPDYGRVTPFALDVSITAYNYSVASRFNTKADWTTANKTNTSSRQTFTTRVYLPRH